MGTRYKGRVSVVSVGRVSTTDGAYQLLRGKDGVHKRYIGRGCIWRRRQYKNARVNGNLR